MMNSWLGQIIASAAEGEYMVQANIVKNPRESIGRYFLCRRNWLGSSVVS